MKNKGLVVLSGGQDSTTTALIAKNECKELHGVTFDYGQKHNSEIIASKKIALKFNIPIKIIKIPDLGLMGGSALTAKNLEVPNFSYKKQNKINIPVTYVPCRNIIFLSFECAYAETINANNIYIGINAVDYSGYPDCRAEFIAAMQNTINIGTKMGNNNKPVKF